MNILLIDDNVESMGDAVASLEKSGLHVEPMAGIADLNGYLQKEAAFDCVILDWLLDGSDSKHARECLGLLREYRFVPVFIYTEQKALYEGEADEVRFPASCIRLCGKDEVSQVDLGKMVKDWLEGFIPGKISRDWRKAVRSSAEKVLYDLAEMDGAGIQATLTFMTKTETGDSPDVDHALDLLQRMTNRHVCSDGNVRSSLDAALRAGAIPTKASESEIWQRHMFYVPGDNVVRPGDVIRMHIDGETDRLGIVLSPACDLATFKTFFLRVAALGPPPPLPAGSSFPANLYALPYLFEGAVAPSMHCVDFHEIITLRNVTIVEKLAELRRAEPERRKLPSIHMTYDHRFTDMSRRTVALSRMTRLDDPYRSDLIQKFSTHASRIGTPDVPTP